MGIAEGGSVKWSRHPSFDGEGNRLRVRASFATLHRSGRRNTTMSVRAIRTGRRYRWVWCVMQRYAFDRLETRGVARTRALAQTAAEAVARAL